MFTIASARMKELVWRYRSLAIRPVLAHSPRFCLRLNIPRQTSCGKFKSRGKSSIRTARFLSATDFVDCTLPCVQLHRMESLTFSCAINGLRNSISKSHHWSNDKCPPCLRTPVHHVSGLYIIEHEAQQAPFDDGLRFDDGQDLPPILTEFRENHPEELTPP